MGLAGGVTSAKVRFDGVDAEAVGAVAHGRVLEAEAWRAALRVVLIQVKVTQLTPEGHKQQEHTCDVLLHELHFHSLHVNGTCVGGTVCGPCASPVAAEALHVVFAATLTRVHVTLLRAA